MKLPFTVVFIVISYTPGAMVGSLGKRVMPSEYIMKRLFSSTILKEISLTGGVKVIVPTAVIEYLEILSFK